MITSKTNLFFRSFLSLALGVMGMFAFPPYNIWALGLLSYASLFFIVQNWCVSKRQVIFLTFSWAMGLFVGGLWWIAQSLLVEGNQFKWAYPLAVLGLPALLSSFPIVANLFYFKIKSKFQCSGIGAILIFTIIFFTSEWLRGHIFTGFPWNLPAYIWSEQLNLLQSLSIIGPYGLSFLTLLLAISVGGVASQIARGERKKDCLGLLCTIIMLFIGIMISGHVRLLSHNTLPSTDHTLIRIIQPNIAQKDKWNPDLYLKNLETIQDLALSEISLSDDEPYKNVMLILPETALNDVMMSTIEAREILKSISRHYQAMDKELFILTGALRSQFDQYGDREYYNSALLYDQQGYILNDYNKSHLVPFGEYMPLSNVFDIAPVVGFSGFSAGAGAKTISHNDLPSIGIAICYEIIFPSKFIDKHDRPDIAVTITNDAWYGDTPGPYQHFMMARYRAIEENTPVVRVANTGISGVFDEKGRIMKYLDLNERGIIDILH